MRPTVDAPGSVEYECLSCAHRQAATEAGVCERCGGELWNVSVSRDL